MKWNEIHTEKIRNSWTKKERVQETGENYIDFMSQLELIWFYSFFILSAPSPLFSLLRTQQISSLVIERNKSPEKHFPLDLCQQIETRLSSDLSAGSLQHFEWHPAHGSHDSSRWCALARPPNLVEKKKRNQQKIRSTVVYCVYTLSQRLSDEWEDSKPSRV